jgi:hypothetical protein
LTPILEERRWTHLAAQLDSALGISQGIGDGVDSLVLLLLWCLLQDQQEIFRLAVFILKRGLAVHFKKVP